MQKLRGGYYTPDKITKFISKWVIGNNTKTVLEPSCGDGNFIEAIIKRFKELNFTNEEISQNIQGIELISEESIKAKKRAENLGINNSIILNSDFFTFSEKYYNSKKFDGIVGNPPFIRYQNFPQEHRDKALMQMKELGLNPNKLTNIWIPFLVISSSMLTHNGRLGMVIPAELFQVKYATETRIFLSKFFSKVTIITFKKLVFDNIQQEVVLLLCQKNSYKGHGIRVFEVQDLDELEKFDVEIIDKSPVKDLFHDSEKWTKYFLNQDEIILMRNLKKKIPLAKESIDVDVGIVTGKNEFFMIKKNLVNKWNLENSVVPVVSRTPHLKGIEFTKKDLKNNIEENLPTYLYLPNDIEFENLPKEDQKYIKFGEENDHHTGYKCRIRKRWYITPSIWIPEGFALRQVNRYPRLILNSANTCSTDTIHRVRFKEGVDKKQVILSYFNSLTFAFSEITGRSYGGGVLTFEPTEVEELPLPILENKLDFDKIDQLIREDKIEEVLDIIDNELLIKQLKLSKNEVLELRNIWKKLSNRRLNRKNR